MAITLRNLKPLCRHVPSAYNELADRLDRDPNALVPMHVVEIVLQGGVVPKALNRLKNMIPQQPFKNINVGKAGKKMVGNLKNMIPQRPFKNINVRKAGKKWVGNLKGMFGQKQGGRRKDPALSEIAGDEPTFMGDKQAQAAQERMLRLEQVAVIKKKLFNVQTVVQNIIQTPVKQTIFELEEQRRLLHSTRDLSREAKGYLDSLKTIPDQQVKKIAKFFNDRFQPNGAPRGSLSAKIKEVETKLKDLKTKEKQEDFNKKVEEGQALLKVVKDILNSINNEIATKFEKMPRCRKPNKQNKTVPPLIEEELNAVNLAKLMDARVPDLEKAMAQAEKWARANPTAAKALTKQLQGVRALKDGLVKDRSVCKEFVQHSQSQKQRRQTLDTENKALAGMKTCVTRMVRLKTGPAMKSWKVAQQAHSLVETKFRTLSNQDQLRSNLRSQMDPQRWVMSEVREIEAAYNNLVSSKQEAEGSGYRAEIDKIDKDMRLHLGNLKARDFNWVRKQFLRFGQGDVKAEIDRMQARKSRLSREYDQAKRNVQEKIKNIQDWWKQAQQSVNAIAFLRRKVGMELPAELRPPPQSIPQQKANGDVVAFADNMNKILDLRLGPWSDDLKGGILPAAVGIASLVGIAGAVKIGNWMQPNHSSSHSPAAVSTPKNLSPLLVALNGNSCSGSDVRNPVTNAIIPRPFPYQQVLRTVLEVSSRQYKMELPGNSYTADRYNFSRQEDAGDMRLLVNWRTGSGKTLGMVSILDLIWDEDPRPKIFIFPTDELVDNFYKTLARFHNTLLEWAVEHGSFKEDKEAYEFARSHPTEGGPFKKQGTKGYNISKQKLETPFAKMKATGLQLKVSGWNRMFRAGIGRCPEDEDTEAYAWWMNDFKRILEKKNTPNLNSENIRMLINSPVKALSYEDAWQVQLQNRNYDSGRNLSFFKAMTRPEITKGPETFPKGKRPEVTVLNNGNTITKDWSNPFDNKCIFMDEAHTLFRKRTGRHEAGRQWLLNALTACRRSVMCLFTASPIVDDPMQGLQMGRLLRGLTEDAFYEEVFSELEQLIRTIKAEQRPFSKEEAKDFGEKCKQTMSGYVLSMMASPEPLYPRMKWPRSQIAVFLCPVGGRALVAGDSSALSPEERQRQEQIGTGSTSLNAFRDALSEDLNRATSTGEKHYHLSDRFTKFGEIARYVVEQNRRTVIMVDDDKGLHVFADILAYCIAEKEQADNLSGSNEFTQEIVRAAYTKRRDFDTDGFLRVNQPDGKSKIMCGLVKCWGDAAHIPGMTNKAAIKKTNENRRSYFEKAVRLFNEGEAAFLVADSKAFKEGVGFFNVDLHVIMQPPSDYASYKQLLGRSERACKSTKASLEIFVAVSTRCADFDKLQRWVVSGKDEDWACGTALPTQDEQFLRQIVLQRSQIEPILKMMFDDVQMGKSVMASQNLVQGGLNYERPLVRVDTRQRFLEAVVRAGASKKSLRRLIKMYARNVLRDGFMGCANIDGINPEQCRRFTKKLNKRLSKGIRFKGEKPVEKYAFPPPRTKQKKNKRTLKRPIVQAAAAQAPTQRTKKFAGTFGNTTYTLEIKNKSAVLRTQTKNADGSVTSRSAQVPAKGRKTTEFESKTHSIKTNQSTAVVKIKNSNGSTTTYELQKAKQAAAVAVKGGAQEAAYRILFPGLMGGSKTEDDVLGALRTAFASGDKEAIRATEAACVLLRDRPLQCELSTRQEALETCRILFS